MNLKEKLKNITSEAKSDWLKKSDEQLAQSKSRKNARKVALRVLQILHEQGISQTQLAERMGVSRQRVADIVKGKENFTFETIDKLESALGVTLMTIQSGPEPVQELTGMQGVFPVPLCTLDDMMATRKMMMFGNSRIDSSVRIHHDAGHLMEMRRFLDPLSRATFSLSNRTTFAFFSTMEASVQVSSNDDFVEIYRKPDRKHMEIPSF